MAATAARSMLRSPSLRFAASRLTSAASASASASRPSLRRLPNMRPSSPAARFLRSPVETSFCVESLMPMHSATASAVMTSMLSISSCRRGWISDAANDDV